MLVMEITDSLVVLVILVILVKVVIMMGVCRYSSGLLMSMLEPVDDDYCER